MGKMPLRLVRGEWRFRELHALPEMKQSDGPKEKKTKCAMNASA